MNKEIPLITKGTFTKVSPPPFVAPESPGDNGGILGIMAFEKPDVPAFKNGLKESPFNKAGRDRFSDLLPGADLMEFQDNDNYVVRKATEKFHAEHFHVTDYAMRTKKAFADLDHCGIHAPIQLVVAEDRNDKSGKGPDLFVITDKVAAVPLESMRPEQKAKAGEEFHALLQALTRYYETAFETGSEFLMDLSEREQYVYGKKPGDSEDSWYLVDTDPILADDHHSLATNVEMLDEELDDMEAEFSLAFEDVRERIITLLDKLEEE
jgi:hypothetical protein